MSFRIDTSDLEKAYKRLQELGRKTPVIAVRSINKTLPGVRTDMVSFIRKDYNYKATKIRKRLSLEKASIRNISGYVQSKGRLFHLTDVVGTRQNKKGVSVNVRKKTGRQLLKHAFIAHGKTSQKKIVFIRTRKGEKLVSRYPIQAISTAHPEVIYHQPEMWNKIKVSAAERLDKNIKREIGAQYRREQGKW